MVKVYCHSCSRRCVGDVLKVGDRYFHQNCFQCKDCLKKLNTGGFFYRDGSYYCTTDYTNRFSNKCFVCGDVIGSEIVSALNHHFHRNCFQCSSCKKTFVPGNRVTKRNNLFLCSDCSGKKSLNANDAISACSPAVELDSTRDSSKDKATLSDDATTDQGYISADPTSVSSPVQPEEICEKRTLHQLLTKAKSRSLFEFGQFYNTSYLEIEEKRVMERQSHKRLDGLFSKPKYFQKFIFPASASNRCLKSRNDVFRLLSRSTIKPELIIANSFIESNLNEKENVIRLSSYPSGEKHPSDIPFPIERDDWPAPPFPAVLFREKMKRQRKLLGSVAETDFNQMTDDCVLNYTQSLDHLALNNNSQRQRNLIEILNNNENTTGQKTSVQTLISASRSPDASTEPSIKTRFTKSRQSSYFSNKERHKGYSLDFISSTGRQFLVYKDRYVPYSTTKSHSPKRLMLEDKLNSLISKARKTNDTNNNSDSYHLNRMIDPGLSWTAVRTMSDTFDVQLKTSEYDSTYEDTFFENEFTSSEVDLVTGLKSIRSKPSKDRFRQHHSTSEKSSISSRIESLENWSFWSQRQSSASKIIPYIELIAKNPITLKGLDIHKLETYLSTQEFQQLFNLNRVEFYRLPEWKQNDLKRRVKLF